MDHDRSAGECHHPDGSSEKFQYDRLVRLDASIDTSGRTTRYQRNARGQLVRHINALGRSVEFKYAPAHRLARLINENCEASGFGYDRNDKALPKNRLERMTEKLEHLKASMRGKVGQLFHVIKNLFRHRRHATAAWLRTLHNCLHCLASPI